MIVNNKCNSENKIYLSYLWTHIGWHLLRMRRIILLLRRRLLRWLRHRWSSLWYRWATLITLRWTMRMMLWRSHWTSLRVRGRWCLLWRSHRARGLRRWHRGRLGRRTRHIIMLEGFQFIQDRESPKKSKLKSI